MPVVAVTVVNLPVVAVVAPIVALSMEPPVIATEFAFCVDIVPRPDTAVFAIAIAVFVTEVSCPCALTANTGTEDAEPYVDAVTAVLAKAIVTAVEPL